MFGGVGFIGFNLFLISRIDPNQKESLPHHELNYEKLGDFSDPPPPYEIPQPVRDFLGEGITPIRSRF